MKRFLVYIFILCSATLSAATMRHLNMDVDNVPAEQISEYFEEWFNLPEGTSFAIGYRGSHVMIQAAYQYSRNSRDLYAHEQMAPATINQDIHRVVVTLGWHN